MTVQAYADYEDLMDLTEKLISEMVLEVNNGSYLVSYHADGPDQPAVEIDFKPPWKRISMISGLEEALSVSFPQNLDSEEARVFLAKIVSSFLCFFTFLLRVIPIPFEMYSILKGIFMCIPNHP